MLTPDVKKHFDLLRVMAPKDAYSEAARARFATNEAFSDLLTGIAKLTNEIVDSQLVVLPVFSQPAAEMSSTDTPEAAATLRETMHALQTVSNLALWWEENAPAFRDAWLQLVGRKNENDEVPERSIAGSFKS